jgi:Zn-finger nucleic acid-binding protein
LTPACPACGVVMQAVRWHDLDGFECPACRGHLIRAKQLESFLERHGPEKFGEFVVLTRGGPPSARKLTCPGCGTRSFRVLRRGLVEIDVCASCSCVYFDEGEATLYLRQTLVRKFGADTTEYAVGTADVLGTLLESIVNFLD